MPYNGNLKSYKLIDMSYSIVYIPFLFKINCLLLRPTYIILDVSNIKYCNVHVLFQQR